eukprot:4027767-Amphidinium_carterae.2
MPSLAHCGMRYHCAATVHRPRHIVYSCPESDPSGACRPTHGTPRETHAHTHTNRSPQLMFLLHVCRTPLPLDDKWVQNVDTIGMTAGSGCQSSS